MFDAWYIVGSNEQVLPWDPRWVPRTSLPMSKKSRPDKCQWHSASIPVVRVEADIHLSRVADLPSGEAPTSRTIVIDRRATVLLQKIDETR